MLPSGVKSRRRWWIINRVSIGWGPGSLEGALEGPFKRVYWHWTLGGRWVDARLWSECCLNRPIGKVKGKKEYYNHNTICEQTNYLLPNLIDYKIFTNDKKKKSNNIIIQLKYVHQSPLPRKPNTKQNISQKKVFKKIKIVYTLLPHAPSFFC